MPSRSPTIKILDGGLGTTLEDHHAQRFDHTKPLWSSHLLISDPATLLACQTDFVSRGGADVLLTATYQINKEAFLPTKTDEFPHGIPESAIPRFLRTALEVAAAAAGTKTGAGIALSCGPYGSCLKPSQEYGGVYDEAHTGVEKLRRWHAERLGWYTSLCEDGGDLAAAAAAGRLLDKLEYIAFETIPRVDEIKAVRVAMGRRGRLLPAKFWISCVFPGEEGLLPDGSTVLQAVEAMLDKEVDGEVPWGIGINCTKIHKLAGLIGQFEGAVKKLKGEGRIADVPALVLYPDGTNGEVYNTATKTWEVPTGGAVASADQRPWAAQLASIVEEAQQRGVFKEFLVGGCCKANPRNIRELRESLKDV